MTAFASSIIPQISIPAPVLRKAARILVVDDEPLVCRMIAEALRGAGYEDILFSSNGSDVPSLALAERPHLIIMDVMMPGGNGWRALRSLKQSPATAWIPVIMASGFSIPAFEDCPHSMADHVLAKPFRIEELCSVAAGLLEGAA